VKFGRAFHPDRLMTIDLTPLIDVVFLLIIFFMTTAQFARLTRSPVELPLEPGERQTQPEEAGLVVNLTDSGQIVVASQTIGLQELGRIVREEVRLTTEDPLRARVLIRADRNADARLLNQVVALLQGMGIGAARLGTEVPRAGGGGP
jgi:biopolymer transport protein ExbD